MKQLRKLFGMFLVLAVCSFSAVSCINLSIEDLVEVANSKYPKKMDGGMTMEKVTYADKVVCFYVTVDENVTPLNASEEVVEFMRQGLIDVYKPVYKEDALLAAVVEQNLTLKFKYSGNISGELFDIEIEGEELK